MRSEGTGKGRKEKIRGKRVRNREEEVREWKESRGNTARKAGIRR